MVSHDLPQSIARLISCPALVEILNDTSNSTKCLVARREDGHVWRVCHALRQVGCLHGASRGCEVRVGKSVGHVLRDGEDAVDDVDCAAGEVDVLAEQLANPVDRALGFDTLDGLEHTGFTTETFCFQALMNVTLSSRELHSTRWPPVTFV